MWLERFSGQSTPSRSLSRPESPAPRRSFQLGPSTLPRRPGISPRQSSLSTLSLGGSSDSLPAAARFPNGSSLRTELASLPTSDVPNPLDVLGGILGGASFDGNEDAIDTVSGGGGKLSASEDDINFGGMSLEEYADAHLEQSERPAVLEAPVVQDYEKEKDKFEDLHRSILACDEVLNSVETYLTSFRADLAAVSAEIESLQNRSASLNTKLDNRKIVEKALGPEVAAFVMPPLVVRKITEGTVDDTWVKSLDELERRSNRIEIESKEGRNTRAVLEVKPFIEAVSDKAVERIRDYVVSQIKALRSPSINAQVVQQNNLLRHKHMFAFLAKRQPQLAEEVTQAYINTMRWYYLHNFTRYKTALEKLNIHSIDQGDAIAADTAANRYGKPGAMHDTFSIGRRGGVIRSSNDVALSSYLAEEDKQTHYLETPFRAFSLALMDNASSEYSFLTEFFGGKQSFHATNRHFQAIFQPTFTVGHELTKQLIESSLDALGVLIAVRLNQRSAFELQRRKIPAGEGYINGTNMLLWPRFQQIIDAHVDSIRRATSALAGKPAGSALSLTSSPATAQTTAPHPLTQKFANFLQGILSLSSEAGDDEPVSNSLNRLRNEFEAFLVKLSKGISEARKRDRFLFNNYSLVYTIVAEEEGKMAEEQKGRFEDLRDALNID